MALPPQFLEELRARTPLPGLIGRRVKLARSGRQWKGCCPFHGEKTPSFYVYDDHFHCFGCGAHGDAISFAMQISGAGFPEAVAQLAAEAGLDVPRDTPENTEREQQRHTLHAILAAALLHFQHALHSPDGRAGLAYLRDRGLHDETIRDFALGWAGDGNGLRKALERDGISAAQMAEAGLLRPSDNGGIGREMFFNRVIFPIRDRRGRVISFGGRTLADAQPKYVNGPETPVFSKRRALFGLDRAREGAKHGPKHEPVLAVEGYLDVIALHQAGLTGAVAPLGTALTIEQLEELWRLSPDPVLCFDGDGAGRRAALRAMDLALPALTPERTLKIAALPEGQDPDSLVRGKGSAGMRAEIARAVPLAKALYDALRNDAGPNATPEIRAGFRARLVEAAERIGHKGLSIEYRTQWTADHWQEGRNRLFAGRGRKASAANHVRHLTPVRPASDNDTVILQRLGLMTAILLRHPALLHDLHDAFCRLHLPDNLNRLRHEALDWSEHADRLDADALRNHLHEKGLAEDANRLFYMIGKSMPFWRVDERMPAEAAAEWWHYFELLHPGRLEQDIEDARQALNMCGDDASHQRLIRLCIARNALRSGEHGLAETA